MKKCPYCAQAIQDDAQVCPHCKLSLTATPGAPPPPPPPGMYQTPMPPQPGGFAGNTYGMPMGQPQNSGKAIASLISGISAYVIFPFLGAIVAVVLGHLGLSEIKKAAGRLQGSGMAVAGLVLGYIQIAGIPFILIIAAIAIPNLIRSRMAANEASAVGSLRTITTSEIAYATRCPQIGFARSLQELGPKGTACPSTDDAIESILASGLKHGYRFTPHFSSFTGQVPETGFGWEADPLTEATGTRHFFVDQTGVIRFSTTGPADENSEALQ